MTGFLTSFADQAVILPLILAVGIVLAALGWRRGALAWTGTIVAAFGLILALKLVAFACGPPLLRSPSGHTAAAAIVTGGLAAALVGAAGWRTVVAAAAIGGSLIGLSRVLLGVHTVPEVVIGGAIGVAGALILARLAGDPPPRARLSWLLAVVLGVVVLFHGWRLNAEPRIHLAALGLAHGWHVCRGR